MDYYFEKQQTNREKAKRAFCEFFDCFIEADPEFRDVIGRDIVTLMALKANTDKELNKALEDTFELIKKLSELRTNTMRKDSK